MTKSLHRRALAPAIAVATLFCACLVSRPAQASPTIGADLDVGFPLHSRGDSGWGFGIRLGQELHGPLLVLTPEIGFTYHGFSGDFGPKIYRGIIGARLGIGEIIRPGAFVHVGLGHFVPTYGDNQNAFTLDAGGFLDLTIIPFLNVGAHVAYNRVDADYGSGAYAFLTVGLHAALVF
jgi:hypothetical protein